MVAYQINHALEVGRRFIRRAAHVGAVVAFAHRNHIIYFVHTEFECAFGALDIGHQHGNRQAGQCQCMRHHVRRVGKLRQQFHRHERTHFHFAHAGGVFVADPLFFNRGGDECGDALQAVAGTDFGDFSLGHDLLRKLRFFRSVCRAHGARYLPLNTGLRFSPNARTPSRRSSVTTVRLYASISIASPVRRSTSSPRRIAVFA